MKHILVKFVLAKSLFPFSICALEGKSLISTNEIANICAPHNLGHGALEEGGSLINYMQIMAD